MEKANRKILITGASGFIGLNLLDEALRRGYEPYAAVRKSTDTATLKRNNIRIVQTDLSHDEQAVSDFSSLPHFRFVIHNAGIISAANKKDFYKVNADNTKHLLHALRVNHMIPKKFLFISSLAASGPSDGEKAIDILTNDTPVSDYGKSKLAAEQIITKSKVPHIIFRPTAVYGPGDREFLKLIRLINKGVSLQLGMGSKKFSFIYVRDLARLVFDALESPQLDKTYLVTDGNLYDSFIMGKYMSEYLGKKAVHISIPVFLAKLMAFANVSLSQFSKKPPLMHTDKITELSAGNWECDITPLRNDFSFKAEYDLRKGMEETVLWYKEKGWI